MKVTQPVTSLCIITFQQSSIDLRNIQNISLIYLHIQYDVGGCVICISNKVEYLDKEGNYINSTKEVV